MASLKSLKVRIKSVKSTQKITKAMKVVAASKLRRARARLEASSPYFKYLEDMVANVFDSIDLTDLTNQLQRLLSPGENKKSLIIITSSDRGLCGGFNTNIFKAARKFIAQQDALGVKYNIVTIGNKADDILKSTYGSKIIKSIPDITKNPLNFSVAEQITKYALELFNNQGYDHVYIIYSHFKSAISQEAVNKQLIPLVISTKDKKGSPSVTYEFEPEPQILLEELLNKNIISQVYHALLDNAASEQGSRMSAMDSATRNAEEMIKDLSLVYNRTRQAIITKELIEIISGSEAI